MEGKNEQGSKFGREQYGKKGWKPRTSRISRPKVNLDDITTNKIEYWNKTDAFTNVTKFAWPLIIGQRTDWTRAMNVTNLDAGWEPAQVMRINFVPGPGYTNGDVHDGPNHALAQLMTKIRASLSTSNIGFETADLGIMLASTASIAALIGAAKRAFGVFHDWENKNLVHPRCILKSMGLEYDDMRSHFNDYAGQLKSLIEEYNALELLDIFDVFDRQYTLTHTIFADEDSQYAQLMYFWPEGYYQYDETDPAAPKARFYFLRQGGFTMQVLLDAISGAINAWKRSSDFYTINGPLHRAFKDAPVQSIPQLDEYEVIKPVVDRVMTMQIMNMTIMGNAKGDTLDITQKLPDQDALVWQPSTTIGPYGQWNWGYQTSDTRILRLFEDDPTADDNMELSRLICHGTYYATGDDIIIGNVDCTGAGTEFVTTVGLYSYDGPSNTVQSTILHCNILNLGADSGSTEDDALAVIRGLSPFRYIPAVFVYGPDAYSGTTRFCGVLGDLYNYMEYDLRDFSRLQFQALRSIWTPKNI